MSRHVHELEPPEPAAAPSAVEPGRAAALDRLKHQPQRDLRRQKQVGGVALGAVAAFLFLIYIPSMATLADLRQRITADLRQLQSDRERSRSLPQLRARADVLEEQLAQFRPLRRESGVQEFIERAFDLSMQLQLRDLDCRPGETKLQDSLATTPVQLKLSGNFSNVYTFLRECEQLPHYARIRELKIRQMPKEGSQAFPVPGEVSMDMTIVFFHQAAPASGRPGPA